MKTYKLVQAEDLVIGKRGTPERDEYEFELRTELIGDMIKSVRKSRNLTQEQLGDLIGVKKSQISSLENNTKNVSVETILRVFGAMQANVSFNVQF